MKWLLSLACTLLAVAGCGGRSPMDSCALGNEECGCLVGRCNSGLACVDDMCVKPGTAIASGGSMSGGGSWGSSGGISGGLGGASGGSIGSGGSRIGGGGTFGSGGISSSGGFFSTGGRFGTGGTFATGGRIGMGGNFGTGGRTSAGGSTGFVSFSNGKGNGFIDGWGWVALGAADSLGSPTCLGQPITAGAPCTTVTTWASTSGLCIQGFIPALPINATGADYDNNWGIIVAADCHDPPAPLGASFQSVMIFVSGTPTTGLRAVVHRKGDPSTVNYCVNANLQSDPTSSPAIQFTSFNTACWDGSGTSLTLADVPNLDWIGVQIPSTTYAIKTNLCLTGMFLLPKSGL